MPEACPIKDPSRSMSVCSASNVVGIFGEDGLSDAMERVVESL